MHPPRFASVILDEGVNRLLDYEIPEPLSKLAAPGMRVLVPLRSQLKKGTIFSLKNEACKNVRPLEKLLVDQPLFTPDLSHLALWMAAYYAAPLSKVMSLVLPSFLRKETREKEELFIKPLRSKKELAALCREMREKHPSQAALLELFLKEPKGCFLSDLLKRTKVSKSPVERLIEKKVLSSSLLPRSPSFVSDFFQTKPKVLTNEQRVALSAVTESLVAQEFAVHLLYGITGSGKTEVYLQAIEEALSLGKTALFLVPEISLTEQTTERLRSRFTEKIAIMHHRLSDGERKETWKKMQNGSVKIALGARSALFSPLPRLGLIIVDEEHDASYKQKELAPTYHARDAAIMRAKLLSIPILLGSATPALESYYNATQGKYRLSMLTQRPEKATLPQIQIIDMKKEFEKAKGFTLFSEALLGALKKRFEVGEQALLFLNRRGYHTSQICLKCSYLFKCPHCDLSLTFHRKQNALTCHLCGYSLFPPPATCPQCREDSTLKFKGAGTEQVERALHALLPTVRTLRMDADTTRLKGSLETLFKQFRSGKADVLIGTQMIAKGLHFPSVTLVGILQGDGGLHLPDFRASEMSFQLLSQVAGRSVRGVLPGEVLIQTTLTDHPLLKQAALQDYTAFYTQEIESRKTFAYPPFTRLIKLVFTGKEKKQTEGCAVSLRQELVHKLSSDHELFPVTPCGHAKIKENYRFQVLIKARDVRGALFLLNQLLNNRPLPKSVHLLIDVDPLSTYF